jgi:hypothetical protein
MGRFFNDFELERTSFWLGFLAGFLFLWLLGRLRPLLRQGIAALRRSIDTARLNATSAADIRLRNDALRRAQGMHLAASLFSLDEILLTPRLLAPPQRVVPGETPVEEDAVGEAIPYIPDWPELGAHYGAPTFTLEEALQGGTDVVLIGHPGSGRSVALAYLAIRVARRESLPANLEQRTPLLVHSAEISLPATNPEDLLEPLIGALRTSGAVHPQSRLLAFLELALQNGRILLLVDGLDELPPAGTAEIIAYLTRLKTAYPSLRLVATASLEYYDGLARLGCTPLAMAAWNSQNQAEFVQRWSSLWAQYCASPGQPGEGTDPLLVNAWLLSEARPALPLDCTLKAWAAYAEDGRGSMPGDVMQAYIQRMCFDKNGQFLSQGRQALEQVALQMLLSNQPYLTQNELDAGARISAPLADRLDAAAQPTVEEQAPEELESPALRSEGKVKISHGLPVLLENGILVSRSNGKLHFNHPSVCAYLAGSALSSMVGLDAVFARREFSGKPGWDTSTLAMGYFFAQGSMAMRSAEKYLAYDSQPLHAHMLTAARWLMGAPAGAHWRTPTMRRLITVLQDATLPISLRARLTTAMVLSRTPGVQTMLHQMCTSPDAQLRQMAALGMGLYYDFQIASEKPIVERMVADLIDLFGDLAPVVRRAACLGLVGIGNHAALEAVADALLSGDEDLRLYAAEALANHPEEGFPTLREGTSLDDILVRRAVVAGLQRVRQPWAAKTLEEIQLKEEQWVVKNAATRALELIALPNPRIPQPLPALSQTPWFIAFAGERGIGVVPGKPAYELLLKALREGKEEQQLAALEYLRQNGDEIAIETILDVMHRGTIEVREAAFNTLWHLAATYSSE